MHKGFHVPGAEVDSIMYLRLSQCGTTDAFGVVSSGVSGGAVVVVRPRKTAPGEATQNRASPFPQCPSRASRWDVVVFAT